jgi:universal stress protein E
MKEITRIVVANDRLDGLPEALEKAAMIEHYTGASIDVMEVVYDTIAEEPPEVLPREQQTRLIEAMKAAERTGLRNLIEPFRQRVAVIEPQVLWNKQADAAIVDALGDRHDQLLIKPVSTHSQLTDFFQTPLDWALMREARCPVLISKGRSWETPRHVLAAIDVSDAAHDALCREILNTAATLAGVLGTDLHIATSYPSLGQHNNELQVAMDYQGIKADMRENRARAIQRWIDTLSLQVADVQIVEGKPTEVIPDLANQLEATLTVLGTAARKGLRKLLIGNTAESIIGRLHSDIVTVREPWN